MLPRRQLINVAIILFLLIFTFMKLKDRYTQPFNASSIGRNATSSIATKAKESASRLVPHGRFGYKNVHDLKSGPPVKGKVAEEEVDWSKFAYVLYATEPAYLCNSVMIIEQLYGLGAKPDLVLLYPNHIILNNATAEGTLIMKARDEYRAIVKPVQILRKEESESDTWEAAHTKFLAFNQTDYDRVLHLDSDATVLQTMDELFLLPQSPMAMPRAYWISQSPQVVLCSALMLIKPSSHEYDRVLAESQNATKNEYDMEMVNDLYRNEAIVLPHHAYAFLTGEFRNPDHKSYLGEDVSAVWDPDAALKKAKYVHFSDYPMPKPWIEPPADIWRDEMPKCYDKAGNLLEGTAKDQCRNREIWVGIYEDFKTRRTDVCGTDFAVRSASSKRKNRLATAQALLDLEEEGRELKRENIGFETDVPDVQELRTPDLA